MATIAKRSGSWRAQVLVRGVRVSKTFNTKTEAQRWATAEESHGRGKVDSRLLVEDAIRRQLEEAINTDAPAAKIGKLKRLLRHPIANARLSEVSKSDLSAYRDSRLKLVSPASVLREMNDLRGLFRRCRREWGTMNHDPFDDMALPKDSESRGRRISSDEIEKLRHAFNIADGLEGARVYQRVGLAFLFALETAMRSGEIVGLTWKNVHIDSRYAHLPRTKNGDKRDVPLSKFAIQILESLPRTDDDRCFLLTDTQRDSLWQKHRRMAAVEDLRFHDSRAEAIWRLSKKLDVLQLARSIGHRDLQSLMIYYRESASDMASKLD